MTSIIAYNKWDVILVPFPFTDLSTVKKRPSLVVSPDSFNVSEDLVIAFITSNLPDELRNNDYLIKNWKQSGLLRPSIVRMKFATISKSKVLSKLGTFLSPDKNGFNKVLIDFFT